MKESGLTPAIEAAGYGLSGGIGGLPRTTYYTPDGRVIQSIPSMREAAIRDRAGHVVRTVVRDANLDKGWLLSPPARKKPFCPTCDLWHGTQREVAACAEKRRQLIQRAERKTQKEKFEHTASLEQQVAELTALVKRLMEGKDGQVLQSGSTQQAGEVVAPVPETRQPRAGKVAVHTGAAAG